MLFFWRGLGFLVPLVWVASLLITSGLVGERYYEAHGWPKLLAGLLAAVATGILGARLNKDRSGSNTHTFFFLNMEIWALISVVIGIWLAAK